MTTKQCRKCKEWKSLDDFHLQKTNKDGRHAYCKFCAIENAKKYYVDQRGTILPELVKFNARRRKQFKETIDYFKAKEGCKICGEDDPCCIDFHHLDGKSKEATVALLCMRKSPKKIVKEINKCVCVCSNCHRKIHANKLKVTKTDLMKLNLSDFMTQFEIAKEFFPDEGKRPRKKDETIYQCKCGKVIRKESMTCIDCTDRDRPHKVPHPTKEELFKLLWEMPTIHIAKKLGVSDKAIEKWSKSYGLQKPPRGYWAKQKS